MVVFYLPILLSRETYKDIIVKRRRARHGVRSGQHGGEGKGPRFKAFLTETMTRPLHMLFTEPVVGFCSLYMSFNFALAYVFYAAFGYIFSTAYDLDLEEQGLILLGFITGALAGTVTVTLIDWRQKTKAAKELRLGKEPHTNSPESGLYLAMMGSIALPISLFWFAWTARPEIHWMSPAVASALFEWGDLLVYVCFLFHEHFDLPPFCFL